MIVVSDTTPIISLMKAGQLELLQKLFGVVYIPDAVYRELTENEVFSEEVRMVQECEFLFVEEVDNGKSVTILRNFTGLDAGESEAIILADEKNSDVLLMDEHKGRQVAKKMGITITGTIGILTQAFDEGMLTREDVEGCIERLKESGIRISEKLYQKLREYMEKNMMKDVLIVLGNGFSIDFVNFIQKGNQIDLSNLFSNGDKVLWPADNQPGFLSKYRCPALWELGARPNINAMQSSKIIEDIITCANVSASSEHPAINSENTNVYIRAYHELVIYLKYLFIYYNRMICDSDFDNAIAEKWGWSELLNNLNVSPDINSVTVITYNYDIILERLLGKLKIDYQMVGFQSEVKKYKIIKPHGSISFRSKKEYDKESFSIKYNRDSLGGSLEDLVFDLDVGYEKISNINTMIPPAGESGRYKLFWSKILKEKAIESVRRLQEDDDVMYGGVSYCNVDRGEIDEQIIHLNSDVNLKIINPDSNNTFCAVISSLFKQYIHYTQSDVLGGLYK